MAPGLFDDQEVAPTLGSAGPTAGTPLAERLRPRNLDEIVGQEEVVGARGFLRRAITQDRVPSLIFWGPPGTGKTTLARIIAAETSSQFVPFSAVTSGIKEIKEVMAEASRLRQAQGKRTLLFVDEIHRFNRAQQDAFLPYVERGDIVLVGATTENPSFELNAALLSRCRVVVLQLLSEADLVRLLERAVGDPERGLGKVDLKFSSDALRSIAGLANGDARRALGILELVADDASGGAEIGAEAVQDVVQRKILLYDKSGEEHFNLISALHKSLRESDPDASLYWLGRMLAAGEDPLYLARRMVRFASEDIGLADPQALVQALAATDAYRQLGTPEGELALAQAILYMALAPKSNAAYAAYNAVRQAIEERPTEPVPLSIRNASTRLMSKLGYGKGYVYAPDTETGVGGLECLPDALRGTRFYQPRGEGFEARLLERLKRFAELRAAAKTSR
ncbi:MAG: replication-associated recombination protein A [Acidobacteriota bacterium]